MRSIHRAYPMALVVALAACTTAPPAQPTPQPPAPETSPSAPPVTAHRPSPLPWVFGPWSEQLIVAPTLADIRLAGAPIVDPDAGFRARRPIDEASLAPDLRAVIGRELAAVTTTGGACRLRVDGFEAVSAIDPELDDTTSLYPEDEDMSTVPEAVFAQRLWDLGHKALAARITWQAPCDEPLLAWLEPRSPALAQARPARPDERAAALRVVRRHGLWQTLEAGYHESIRLARAHADRLADEGHDVDLPPNAPPHWDAPRDRDDPGPSVEVWSDPTGAARYHLVRLGNDLTCEAPRAWLLVDPTDARVVRFGLEDAPLMTLDLDADGAWELAKRSMTNVWIERLTAGSQDDPEILRAASDRSDGGIHCGWNQVPPLARIREILARPQSPETP